MAHIEKRGKSYRIRASVGYRVDGRQVQPSMTWTPDPGMTQKQIERALTRQAVLFDETCKSLSVQSGHIKFSVFVFLFPESIDIIIICLLCFLHFACIFLNACMYLGVHQGSSQ